MKYGYYFVIFAYILGFVMVSGCSTTSFGNQQAGNFGNSPAGSFGSTAEQQVAIQWFVSTYGDPRGSGTPAFIEPMVSTNVVDSMPADKVTSFSRNTDKIFFWVFYEHFTTGDTITMDMVYTTNGKTVLSSSQPTTGEYGAATGSVSPPAGGWLIGDYLITISGKGATKTVAFKVVDGPTVTVPLPYAGTTGNTTGVIPTLEPLVMAGVDDGFFTASVSNVEQRLMTATGGSGNYTWSISAGSLPPGLLMNKTTGMITGTPTTVGKYNFTVQVWDGTNTATRSLSVTVVPKRSPTPASTPLTITPSDAKGVFQVTLSVEDPIIGESDNFSRQGNFTLLNNHNATGGSGNYTWSISAGSPPGLSMNKTTGRITGTPIKVGIYNFDVTVNDGTSTATRSLSVHVVPESSPLQTISTSPATTCIPVAGATVIVKQVGSSEETQIAQTTTGNNGDFSFTVPSSKTKTAIALERYTFNLYVTAPGYTLEDGASNKITTQVLASDGPEYEFVLYWQQFPGKTQNRGSFAVSGKSDT